MHPHDLFLSSMPIGILTCLFCMCRSFTKSRKLRVIGPISWNIAPLDLMVLAAENGDAPNIEAWYMAPEKQ